jgi:ubiquinone biosynthesis protein
MEPHEIIGAIRGWLETIALVPPAHAAYAPLVVDGLLHFLERLPNERLSAIVADQLAIADEATSDERFVALLRQCPTLHKLGQVVARQAGLPHDLRARLQTLETLVPPSAVYPFQDLVAGELGSVPGLTVAADASAEGSVAYVVPFNWTPERGVVRQGVFKALKPHAEERLLQELAAWPELADYLVGRSAEFGLAGVEFRSLLDGVAMLLRNEIRLDAEQQQLARARAFYAGDADVVVPELFSPLCTPRLTAMQRIDGVRVTDARVPAAQREQLARTIVAALIAKPFWSASADQPFFHADPHAGNLFATPDGKLAVFDWALTTRLSDVQLGGVVQAILAAAVFDEPGVSRALGLLAEVKHVGEVRSVVARALAEIRYGALPGFGWLVPLLDRLGRSSALIFPQETALFRKSLLTLAGVIGDLWPNASIDGVVMAGGGRQFVAESWQRAFAPLTSRAFGTHVSNDDIVRFLGALTWAPARYLRNAFTDALGLWGKIAQ